MTLRNALRATCLSLALHCWMPDVLAGDQPAPFADGDAKLGKPIVARDCVACHARRMAGDAEKMYLRSDRRVHTPEQLLAQVSYCNSELGTHYFPDEEAHIAAYLNAEYYRFKP